MIIPVRCFTCGKVLADKWNHFIKLKQEQDATQEDEVVELESEKNLAFTVMQGRDKLLRKYGLNRLCCRRHMLGHVDLIEQI